MSEICEHCGHCVWGVVDGLCPDCTDDLKPNKKHEAGFESGYEKGVRDMWDKMDMCPFNEILCDVKCIFNNCPIAEKLLKAVK